MALRIWGEWEGTTLFDRAWVGVRTVFQNFTRHVADPFRKWFNRANTEQFRSEGGRGRSGKWAPLARSTEEQKLRENPFALNILQRSGALMLSLTRPGAPYSVFEVTNDAITAGTTRPGAVHHQRGTRRMPARPPFDWSDDQLRDLQKELQRGVMVPLRRTGLTVTDLSEAF